MSILIKDTTGRAPIDVRTQAKRFGAQFQTAPARNLLDNRVYGGYILRAMRVINPSSRNGDTDIITVTILAPAGVWWFGGRYYSTAMGYGSDLYNIGYTFPGKYLNPTVSTPAPTPEEDIKTFNVEDALTFAKRHLFYGAAPSVAVGDIGRWRFGSPALNGQTATLPSVWYDIQEPAVAVNGWRSTGHVSFMVTGGDSTFIHIDPSESDLTKTFSRAIVNWRMVVGLASTDFGTEVNVGPNEGAGAALYPTPYAVNIKEVTPETIDGEEQPLRYNDWVVAVPVTLGLAPANIENTRHDYTETGEEYYSIFNDVYANPIGLAFARVHLPYNKELAGSTEVTTVWNTTTSMLDSGVAGVPPADYEYLADDLEDWGIIVPTGMAPGGYSGTVTEVTYCDGYLPHHITSFNCAVREPMENERTPLRGVAQSTAAAQLAAVCTSWTRIDPGTDPRGYCFSTRLYTVALADGAVTETDISTAVRTATSPDPFDPFDHHYVYAACGQAVPLVKIEIDCDPDLLADEPFVGQETVGSTELKLVYADGTVITHDLGGYCPPRPIMRGGTWQQYVLGGYTQFGYNTNDPANVASTALVEYSASPDLTGDLDVNNYTCRRTVIPETCAQQRICVNLGSGRIATLACTAADQLSAVRLDWHLVTTYEDTGEFCRVRGTVFEDLPLESSCWINLNVIQPELCDAEGNVTRPAILAAAIRSPTQFMTPNSPAEPYLFPIHGRDGGNWPSTEAFDTADAPMIEYHNEVRISRNGGESWETLIYNIGTETYFLGSALGPWEF